MTTTNTTDYNFGDIVLVPFPFTDQSATKKRPAVVVSGKAYHRERSDLVIMAVTSQLRANLSGDVSISDWKGAGLLKASTIKPVITTVQRTLVIKKLGQLKSADQQALRAAITAILG